MLKTKQSKYYIMICAVFLISIATYLVYITLRRHSLFIDFGDGNLYISIADNLLKTGHFTQTERLNRLNMIVPFGVPMLLTPLRMLTKSVVPILILQLVLYGTTNIFAFLAEKNFFGTSGVFSVLFLWLATFYRVECSPACIGCTEIWYIFLITAELFVLSLDKLQLAKKLLWLNILTYTGMVIRPFLSPLFIITVILTLYLCLIRKRAAFSGFVPFYIISSLIIVLFLFVNHKESGQWVAFQNYTAMDLWWANNENSDPIKRNIVDFYQYLDSTVGIDYARDNEMYSLMFREYVISHPGKFIHDTLLKFYIMYVEHWFFAIIPAAASVVLFFIRKNRHCVLFAALFALSVVMSVSASTAMICHRYTVFIVPLYALILSGGFKTVCDIVKARKAARNN